MSFFSKIKSLNKRFCTIATVKTNFHDFSFRTQISSALKYIDHMKSSQQEVYLNIFKQHIYKQIGREEVLTQFANTSNKTDPGRILESFNLIYHYLSDAEMGFLSCDLTPRNLRFLSKEIKSEKSLEQILNELLESLPTDNFKLPEDGIPYPDQENQVNLIMRQLVMENLSFEIVQKMKLASNEALTDIGSYQNSGFLHLLTTTNFPIILGSIENEIRRCHEFLKNPKALGNSQVIYAPYLVQLNPETLAMISMISLCKMISQSMMNYLRTTKGADEDEAAHANLMYVPVSFFIKEIASGITNEMMYETWTKKTKESSKKMDLERSEKSKENNSSNSRKVEKEGEDNSWDRIDMESNSLFKFKSSNAAANFKILRRSSYTTRTILSKSVNETLPSDIKWQIAALLVHFMSETFKIKDSQMKLERMFNIQQITLSPKMRLNVVSFSKATIQRFTESLENTKNSTSFMDRALPLVCPPAPWRHTSVGGYYLHPSMAIRVNPGSTQFQINGLVDLTRVYNIMDYVSAVPWKISPYMYSLIDELWRTGGDTPGIPKKYDDLESRSQMKFMSEEASRLVEKVQMKRSLQKMFEVVSLRSDFLLKMKVAESFKDIGKFYFPNNLDFRGRLYPIPPHLNHMGNDLCRGLLMFSNKIPIGKNGLRNLKIHLANKMGMDKLSFEGRVAFVEDNINQIQKYLDDPLKNREWLQLEHCYQAIAAMRELMNALKSDFPEDYMCSLPIHADGSCNGLQHYAALGGDYEGGYEVNLINRDIPGDIYTKVALMVHEKIKRDLENPAHPYLETAKIFKDGIRRKIIKQTVMTTVYGVTAFGARKQIKKQLREFYDFPEERNVITASNYLSELTLEAVQNLFGAAHQIKTWLTSCSKKITERGQPVSWFTPLGLPIIQPYRKEHFGNIRVKTLLNSMSSFDDSEVNSNVDARKQATAFPPNFIHSLDSTHLMLTSERMKDLRLDFAAVHDSYWSQVRDFDIMNCFLREEFVHMQNMNPLENLKHSFEKRFPDLKFDDLPVKGSLDIKEVLKSKYFFS